MQLRTTPRHRALLLPWIALFWIAPAWAQDPPSPQNPLERPSTNGSPNAAPDPSSRIPIETLAPANDAGQRVDAAQRIDELDQKVRIIERRWEVEQEIAAARKEEQKKIPQGVAVPYANDGAGVQSADGKFRFRLRPLFQADGRFFISENTNTFLLRRVRPVLEGTVFEYFDWRIMPELAGTPNIQDAYGNVRLIKEVQFRAGKFKSPVGLERLASDGDLPFVERGLPTQLVPDRDVGLQLHGDLFDSTVQYALGFFNGVDDGVNGDLDNNDKKDWVGRVVVKPFRPTEIEVFRGFGVGIAGTRGTHYGAPPGYRTSGQATFFQYVEGAVNAGTHRRIAPQAFYYYGPVGVFGEFTISSQVISSPTATKRVDHKAWQVVASVFVTGEDASYTSVTPKNQLDPSKGTVGAIELVARYGELTPDRVAFDNGFSDAAKSARGAQAWAVGLNWHLARNFKLMGDYERTNFDGGAKIGDRPHEIVFLTRIQAAY